jgi:predicted lactoylglutathione lyase
MPRSIFLNLPVKDLEKSIDFFSQLGFEFDPRVTDENATCMIINEFAFVMLLVEPFFQTFTSRSIADASSTVEAITAISVESRDEVDSLVSKALEAGAGDAGEINEHGYMYQRAFHDLDGHKWEVFWMESSVVQ